MKKSLYLSMAIGLFLAVAICSSSFAQMHPGSFPYCTDQPRCGQKKVAQVPLPWQFWAVAFDPQTGYTVVDKIRISPTWSNPPAGNPAGDGTIAVQRQVAVIPAGGGNPHFNTPIPLEELVWPEGEPNPGLGLDWQVVDQRPVTLEEGQDLEVEIPVNEDDVAVLVAYEVSLETSAGREVTGHFINEAILESGSLFIVQVFVNMDIHNDTDFEVTNFELDFEGLDFTCADIDWALGYVKGTGAPWGANPSNPLIVRPIGTATDPITEVKWIQPDTPLPWSSWIHIGLSFTLPGLVSSVNATVQGYWTISDCPPEVFCEETVNPHGKKVPPAGKTTMPGPKGGQNEDGFYVLKAVDDSDPDPAIFVEDTGSGTVFGPFSSGDKIKYTEANGATPNSKKIGSTRGKAGAVLVHITGTGDAAVFAVDNAGNQSDTVHCLVPPPPK